MSLTESNADPVLRTDHPGLADLDASIRRARDALLCEQRADGHFAFDLEADAAIPSEYMLVKHFLGEIDPDMERRAANYLRAIQEPHGGWPMLSGGALNVSASVKAYFALKAAGDPVDAPHMARCRQAILKEGGAVNVNIFTRTTLALFGIVPWRAVPAMPVEIMHAPAWFPFHLHKISYWARATLVPLMVLMALKPRARNPRGITLDELFVVPPHEVRRWPATANQTGPWGVVFAGLDRVLRLIDPLFPRKARASAINKAVAFVTERLNGEDGLGGIYPSVANTVMMFQALGVPANHPDVAVARAALEKLVARHGDRIFCQPCLSPVWDTVLSSHALMEAAPDDPRPAKRCLDWLRPLQVLDLKGDWAHRRPNLRPGGWAFQYNNPHYVDVDDTAVVVLAMDRARGATGSKAYEVAIARAREWVAGMQSSNGGWAAFDVDNTAYYLNAIPFADHGALLDPPTADVTARCVSMLGQLGDRPATSAALRRALDYLMGEQHPDGGWFGRWGLNYIYGTWSVLCAFNAVDLDPGHPAVRRAVTWLQGIQNPDGGWGEDDRSYALDYRSHEAAPSTASQTAWALLGLMAAGEVRTSAVRRGVAHLLARQGDDGSWQEDQYTATGFPRVFYLRYLGYPKVFPLWAMARYRNLTAGGTARVRQGL